MASDGTIKISTELDSKKAESAMSQFSDKAKSALSGIVTAAAVAGTAVLGIAGYAVKVGSDFEAGMSKVSAISGATGDDLEALNDKAKEMGANTKFSATEAASAFEYMAMAGWKTEDMLGGIEGIMNLAAASGEDLALTSDIVTDALTGFGMSASDSGHFADILAAASSNANTNVAMMGETFKYVAPVAGALGFSAEDTALAVGLMANSGIKASQAGTSLRSILTRMAKPTKQSQAAMDKLGISLTNTDGSMKTMNEIMGDLRTGFDGLSEAESANMAAALGGQEAMSGLLAIVNASDEDFNKLQASIEGCDGTAEQMAETMQDNLQGKLTILGSTVEGFGIQIYESMEKPLKAAVDKGIEAVGRLSTAFERGGIKGVVKEVGELFGDLLDEIAGTSGVASAIITPFKNFAKSAGNLAKSVLPPLSKAFKAVTDNLDRLVPIAVTAVTTFKAFKIVKSLSTWFGSAATSVKTFGAVLTANPVGLAISGILSVTAGVAAYNMTLDESSKRVYDLSDAQRENLEALEEFSESYNEAREMREENVRTIAMEYDGYQGLLDELRSITDENGNVKAGYEERAKVIAQKLQEELGVEIEVADGKIEKYKEVEQAIQDVITKKEAEALLASMQDDMNNSYKDAKEAVTKYQEALDKVSEADANVAKAQADHEAAVKKSKEESMKATGAENDYALRLQETENALNDAKEAQMEQAKVMVDAKRDMESLTQETSNYRALMEAMESGDTAKIESAMRELISGYTDYSQEMLAQSKDARDEMYAQANETLSALQIIQDEGGAMYATFGADSANELAKIVKNFDQLPGGMIEAIDKMGKDGSAAMVAALAQADLDGKLDDEGKNSLKSLVQAYDNLPPELQSQFKSGVEGAMRGLDGFDEIKTKAEEEGISFLEALREVLAINSPSKKVMEIFQGVWEGASDGLDVGGEELGTKGTETCNSFLDTLKNAGLGEAMKGIGANVMSFFGIGVDSQKENSKLAGKGNADAAGEGAGSVNPTGIGSAFGSLFGGGIGGMLSVLTGKGKSIANGAKSGAGSVNPTGIGSAFGTQYGAGIGSKADASNKKGQRLAVEAESGAKSKDGYTPGSDFGSGFVKGIGDWLKSAAEAAANLALSAYNALKKALAEKSPSRKTKKSGKNFDLGLAVGVEENQKYAIAAAEELSENTLDAIDVDSISEKLSSIDVPAVMARVSAAVDDRHNAISERIIATVEAKQGIHGKQEEIKATLAEEDIKALAKAFAKEAAADITKEMEGMGMYARERELFRMMREVNRS